MMKILCSIRTWMRDLINLCFCSCVCGKDKEKEEEKKELLRKDGYRENDIR